MSIGLVKYVRCLKPDQKPKRMGERSEYWTDQAGKSAG